MYGLSFTRVICPSLTHTEAEFEANNRTYRLTISHGFMNLHLRVDHKWIALFEESLTEADLLDHLPDESTCGFKWDWISFSIAMHFFALGRAKRAKPRNEHPVLGRIDEL